MIFLWCDYFFKKPQDRSWLSKILFTSPVMIQVMLIIIIIVSEVNIIFDFLLICPQNILESPIKHFPAFYYFRWYRVMLTFVSDINLFYDIFLTWPSQHKCNKFYTSYFQRKAFGPYLTILKLKFKNIMKRSLNYFLKLLCEQYCPTIWNPI